MKGRLFWHFCTSIYFISAKRRGMDGAFDFSKLGHTSALRWRFHFLLRANGGLTKEYMVFFMLGKHASFAGW